MRHWSFQSSIGEIWLAHSGKGLFLLTFSCRDLLKHLEGFGAKPKRDPGPFRDVVKRLDAYLLGEREDFEDIPLDLMGGRFETMVWQVLREIPYGEVRSYGWVAGRLGSPGAARAVGQACRRNPVPIIVPCHRVVMASGEPGGYSGGEWLKKALLRIEGHEEYPYYRTTWNR